MTQGRSTRRICQRLKKYDKIDELRETNRLKTILKNDMMRQWYY